MAATLKVRFLADTLGFKTGVKNAQGDLTGFEKATSAVSANIGKALAAISFAAVIKGLGDSAKAAQEDKISSDLLANSLKNTAGATDVQVAAVEKSIGAMSRQYGIADDNLRPALAKLATMTGSTTDAQNLLKLAMDASAATGKPLESVTTALGKAYQGNFGALQKLGIPMLDSVQNAKDLTAANKDLAKKQLDYNAAVVSFGEKSKEATAALKKVGAAQDKVNTIAQQGTDWQKDLGEAFKGAAEKGVDPMKQLNVIFGEFKETIGTALLPVIAKFADILGPIIDKLAPTLARLIEGLAPIFVNLVKALLPLIDQVLPPLVELLAALMPVLTPLIKLLTDILVPIMKIVVAVFKSFLGFLTPIITAVGKLVGALKTGFVGLVSAIKAPINAVIGSLEAFFNFAIGGVNKLIGGINVLLSGLNAVTGLKLKVSAIPKVKLPRLAQGGVVMPTPGGSIVNVAEAGKPEAIIPLDKMGSMGGGNTYVINVNKANMTGEEVIRAIHQYQTSHGRTILSV